MKDRIIRHPSIKLTESIKLSKFTFFVTAMCSKDLFIDPSLSHALYDLEINNDNALRMDKKK